MDSVVYVRSLYTAVTRRILSDIVPFGFGDITGKNKLDEKGNVCIDSKSEKRGPQ